MKLKNIKATFYVNFSTTMSREKCKNVKNRIQKLLIGNRKVTATFYPHKQGVHITGIPNFSYIPRIKEKLMEMFNVNTVKHIVDTLFYVAKYYKTCNLNNMVNWLLPVFTNEFKVEYHPELFSAIQLLPRNCLREKMKLPTVIIFSTMSIIILSRKNVGLVIPIMKKIQKIIKDNLH